MIQKHRIRLNSTESVNSVDKDNKVIVELKQTTKPYFFTTSVREEIDQYEVFKEERHNCTKYRLITTIKPYCTNILFNPVTEIVKKEGGADTIIVTDVTNTIQDDDLKKASGLQNGLNRPYMIQNTEYSSENIGYEYHPGYDIFNNHLLRNTTFKIVNNNRGSNKDIFNTIRDIARDYDGSVIKFKKRSFETDKDSFAVSPEQDMHLYQRDDIMTVTDAINYRLIDDNGWVGFVNQSTINAKDKENKKWYDLDFNRVINNKENCDFVDMYPDRTLYSFNPKYNFYKHRPEYNWKLYLTYPYENFYDHELIKDGKCNAVLIQEAKYTTGANGQDIILFKTYMKHNLNGGSTINLYYYNDDNEYEVIENVIISDIGDVKKNDKDFYFHTSDMRILTELKIDTKGKINTKFRFTNVVNGYESEYYIRIFRKLPNLMKSNKITQEDITSKNKLENFINGCEKDFDKELYKLGFSNTIYNDNNTQITFTDSIEIDNLLDNRGRPLSEIFLTVIKNNAGNVDWYENDQVTDKTEYSHCFSDVTFGFDLYCGEDKLTTEQRKTHARLSNIKVSHTNQVDSIASILGYTMSSANLGWSQFEYNINKDGNTNIVDKDKVIINPEIDDFFIGDIVEYNPTICIETVLSEGQFRFNTYLRDNPNSEKYAFSIDEFKTDDYDSAGFEVETFQETYNEYLFHPEGYYYKAHYPIQLREWGELKQGAHFDLKMKSATKVNIGNKICTVVKTTLPHRLSTSDTLLICCEAYNKIMKTMPVYIFDELTFAIGDYVEYDSEIEGYKTIISASDICDILNGKYETIFFKLRRYNNEIPYYASKTPDKNRYMWRVLNGVGDRNNISLQEYPFANGYFYINQDINFYLKRQDPFKKMGLYYDNTESIIPNDIFGNVLSPSDYEYKEESDVTC